MVEVFKTIINSQRVANKIKSCLEETFPGHNINFDLDDRDKILRVEARKLDYEKIMEMVKRKDMIITVLDK
ncbi:MAG TPA: hypothetical protein DCQ50_09060 [Chryseobacterium sp.]|nr:hypothetical protein [Chryseobacterium sp.]